MEELTPLETKLQMHRLFRDLYESVANTNKKINKKKRALFGCY